jgi:lipoprotein signal peptidase
LRVRAIVSARELAANLLIRRVLVLLEPEKCIADQGHAAAGFNFADAAITMGVIATIASTYLETPSVGADSQG